MNFKKEGNDPTVKLVGILTVLLVLVLVGATAGLVLVPALGRGGDPAAASPSASSPLTSSGAAASQGYPGPTAPPSPPTPTPEPDALGRYPPPLEIPYVIVPLPQSPHEVLLRELDRALDDQDAAAIAGWIGSSPDDPLPLDYYTESEGYGIRPTADEVADLLTELFEAGSQPVIQGYFEPDWQSDVEDAGSHLVVLITGLKGPAAMPTKAPLEELGPPAPQYVPTGSAAWEVFTEADGTPWWRTWWLGDEYYTQVRSFSSAGMGSYSVLR